MRMWGVYDEQELHTGTPQRSRTVGVHCSSVTPHVAAQVRHSNNVMYPTKNDITYCCTLLRGKCSRRGRVDGAEPEYNPTAIQMETRALVVHYTWSWSSNAHMLRLSSMSLRPQRICDECPSTASVWTSALHGLGLRGNRTHPLVPGIPERRDGSIKANAKCERSGEDRGHVYAWR